MAGASHWFHGSAVVSVALTVASCLPGDTRPVPGSLYVTVTATAPLLGGHDSVRTVDGWTVSYDRFLISLGGASFDDGSSCASYYDADYRKIFDVQVPGPQKVGLLYGLGHCDFGFRVAGPNPDSLLGKGVTHADMAMMGAPGTDPYAANNGVALYAKGSATKDAVIKTFSWSFRRRLGYDHCAAAEAGDAAGAARFTDAAMFIEAGGTPNTGAQGVDLKSGVATTLDLTVHGETLFLDSTDLVRAALRFDVLAAADDKSGNGDDDIALFELGQVNLTDIGLEDRYVQRPSDLARGMDTPIWATLEDYLYLGLVPNVVRFEDDGSCIITTGRRR